MSVNYEQLPELLDQMRHGDDMNDRLNAKWELEFQAPALARELLRLRRELTDLRDLMYTNAGYLRKDWLDIAADHAENYAYRLTRIMQGDTE